MPGAHFVIDERRTNDGIRWSSHNESGVNQGCRRRSDTCKFRLRAVSGVASYNRIIPTAFGVYSMTRRIWAIEFKNGSSKNRQPLYICTPVRLRFLGVLFMDSKEIVSHLRRSASAIIFWRWKSDCVWDRPPTVVNSVFILVFDQWLHLVSCCK